MQYLQQFENSRTIIVIEKLMYNILHIFYLYYNNNSFISMNLHHAITYTRIHNIHHETYQHNIENDNFVPQVLLNYI